LDVVLSGQDPQDLFAYHGIAMPLRNNVKIDLQSWKTKLSHAAIPEGNCYRSGLAARLQGLTPWGSFIVCKDQNIAGLASQGAADFLQRFKIDSSRLAFF
jgi:hypothetical protein